MGVLVYGVWMGVKVKVYSKRMSGKVYEMMLGMKVYGGGDGVKV